MQRESFKAELDFLSLKDLSGPNIQIPNLVSRLNLFLDDNNIIR